MTRTLRFAVPEHADGQDVRTFVRRGLSLSARVLTMLKYEGEVLVNGSPARSTQRLHVGDTVQLTLFETGASYEAADLPFPILFQNEDFLVLDKPAGMPVHPSPGHDRDSVLNAAAHYFLDEPGFVFRPLYRLDRDTVGALVLAKNKFAASAELQKTYTAVVEGVPPEAGRIDTPIGLKEGHKVEREASVGQSAVTLFERVKTDGAHSLVNLQLLTGRTHQIRVHMASIGHPVAGDDLYGGHLDAVDAQMLLCSSVHILCRALSADFTVHAEFSAKQKAAFPQLF